MSLNDRVLLRWKQRDLNGAPQERSGVLLAAAGRKSGSALRWLDPFNGKAQTAIIPNHQYHHGFLKPNRALTRFLQASKPSVKIKDFNGTSALYAGKLCALRFLFKFYIL
jgi:hypothetical protein